MSASSSKPFFLFLIMFPYFLFLTITSSTSIPFSSSSIASQQHKLWSTNVRNDMPNVILSKLSPLSMHDSDHFTSLVSKPSFVSDATFCSLASLACAASVSLIKQSSNAYSYDNNNHVTNLNTIKPLSNGYSYDNNKHSTANADPFSFFRLSVLQRGETVHLPDLRDTSPFRAFLPSRIASKISLASNEVLKRVFPESFTSPFTMEAIETTLMYCNARTLKGETKICARSLEEMIRFSKKALGEKHITVLTSKSTKGSGTELLVGNVKAYDNTKKIVSCHEVYLPFSTHFCHLISSSRLYEVELVDPKTKVAVNTVFAVCHMDTSAWPANHVAFKILKSLPGKAEACHWFSQIDLAWIGA